jgi:hypothetical protein
MPTRYECPSCHHLQMQGGACEKCGIDFGKYAAMLVVQAQSAAEQARGVKLKTRSLYMQILLLPITSVVGLYKFLMGLRNGD